MKDSIRLRTYVVTFRGKVSIKTYLTLLHLIDMDEVLDEGAKAGYRWRRVEKGLTLDQMDSLNKALGALR